MILRLIFTSFLIFIVLIGLGIYLFFPYSPVEFQSKFQKNSNFSLFSNDSSQFYPNMRFPNSDISYRIDNCTLKKRSDMEQSLSVISNLTMLRFYSVYDDEEISITCDSKNKVEGRFFIAGEGGPTNITQTEKYNVITHSKVLLLRDSSCPNPNVGIHELLHALGFDHSQNPKNIMYYLSTCDQAIGDDTINLINELYKAPTYSDLDFTSVYANLTGRYLNLDMSIRNQGLKESENTTIDIYTDGKLFKQVSLEPIEVGAGKRIYLTSILVLNRNINEITFFINSSFDEIDKENNREILDVKKS